MTTGYAGAETHRATDKQTGADEAYAVMRQAIRSGDLMPGERLVETELAGRWGLGRNAVRTSLARLEQDALVERSPFRRARAPVIGEAEAVEILEARSVLEGLAARHATQRVTPGQVEELRAVLRQMQEHSLAGDLLATSELNSRLHRRHARWTARSPGEARLGRHPCPFSFPSSRPVNVRSGDSHGRGRVRDLALLLLTPRVACRARRPGKAFQTC